MAATVAASKAYDLAGGALREDLIDAIYDVSPMDTTFMTNAGRGVAKSTTHEWLTDALAAAAANAKVEGDEFAAVARTLPARLKNYTQISRKDFEVTGTAQKVNNAGMNQLLAYHAARAAKEIKRDMEYSMLNNNPASAGTSVSARVSGGVPNWIYSGQHYKNSAQTTQTTTAPVSGFATATGGSWTNSATAYAEADLKSALQLAWSTGGEVDTVLCDSVAHARLTAFTGVATRFRNVESKQAAQIIGYADIYVSPFGSHKLVLSRYMPANTFYGLQMDTWQVDYLRPFQTLDIAKVGDAERRTLLAEWTLVCKQPLANMKAHGVA
jgi:Family of unknown function (DUF5309)